MAIQIWLKQYLELDIVKIGDQKDILKAIEGIKERDYIMGLGAVKIAAHFSLKALGAGRVVAAVLGC